MGDPVLVLTTGGTIVSTGGAEGASPTQTGTDLLRAVPEISDRVTVEAVAQRPSPDVDFPLLDRLRERIAAHRTTSNGGVVVTHGTDTMAESAFYLDLVRDWDIPIVFTGAQRRPDQAGADGPANLKSAVSTAMAEQLRSAGGVYVCLAGELHAARDVVKAHTWRLDAFASPNGGPVAAVGPRGLERYRQLGSLSSVLPCQRPPEGTVEVLSTGIGVRPTQVSRAVEADCDGIVLQTTGLGNASEPVADAVADAVEAGVAVVITTRCFAGPVAAVYGRGGGYTLRENGAILAGTLSAPKARIKLLVALAAGASPVEAFSEN